MLTPADFIFNEQSTSQYVEFNYTPVTFSSRYASYHITEYLLKISDESSTFSSNKNIQNN